MAKLCPLFSGSKGNCTLIGSAGSYVMIDAGKSARAIERAMLERGIMPSDLRAIFITHEHTDHISAVRVFASRHRLPVFATAGTLGAMERAGALEGVESHVMPGGGAEAGGMLVEMFRTSHDAAESCGYIVSTADERRIAIATDMGVVTEEVRSSLSGCDAVVLESNHDVRTLENGPYPYPLKLRILSERGHLSNESCASELVRLVKQGGTRFVLAHLSEENNNPYLCRETAHAALSQAGMSDTYDYRLSIAAPDGCATMVL